MNKFILAFPVPVKRTETFRITEFVEVTSETNSIIIPGCSVPFSVARTDSLARLSDIFQEHCFLSPEDAKRLDSHGSLIFLLGTLKSVDDLNMVNAAIKKMFAAGAIGVYMQQSGTAWIAMEFGEELGDESCPMIPWINYVEKDEVLYTLGLEVFGLPDLCVSRKVLPESESEGHEYEYLLESAAEALFQDGIPAKSGTVVDVEGCGSFTLRAELTGLYPKDAPEYNKNGTMRLIKK